MAILFNKWFIGLIFITLFPIHANVTAHPYHVSATEIEYNVSEKRLEISCKIFTDDFESALNKVYKTKMDFSDAKSKTQLDDLLKKYITTHLAVRSNGKILPLQLFGWETDREAVFVYVTASATDFDVKNITVENTILYDLFTDQMNIVHFIIGKERKSEKLDYPEREINLKF
jgi:hypothetical protein